MRNAVLGPKPSAAPAGKKSQPEWEVPSSTSATASSAKTM